MTVGIVGGGITGLTLQHALAARGVESEVFEADAEPGGVVESRCVDGRVLDVGPQRTRLSQPVASLVEDLDLREQCLEAPDLPLYVYRDGELRQVPFSFRSALETELLSWRGKLRVLLEPLTGPPRPGETVEAFLTRTIGREAAQYVVGPIYAGIYASRPDEMYVEHSLGQALEKRGVSRSLLISAAKAKLGGGETPPMVSFRDGMQTLTRALYERHHDSVHLETPVEAVRAVEDGYDLETGGGTVPADAVVLTTPAAVTSRLLESTAPDTAAALARLRYNSLVTVHLVAETALAATGYKLPHGEGFHTLGVTCNASLFDRDGVYTCYLGGATGPDLLEWSNDRLARTAVDEFRAVTGADAEPLSIERRENAIPAYDTSWTAIDRVAPPDGVWLCANYESRAGIPGRVREARQVAARLADAANPRTSSGQPS